MKVGTALANAICGVLLAARWATAAINLDLDSDDSIKAAAKTAAAGMLTYYTGDQPGGIPGLLPGPYYWWEAGAMFGSLVDYWYYTGDDTYNEVVKQALLFQVGPDNNFMPPNQSKSLGNDDQSFWGIAAMSAAESTFPNPPKDQPQWLALAQAVFNSQALRWDKSTCDGGLRWQIYSFNNGYDYKNSISNGCFFNLAARLGAYTHNNTYFEWANKAWDWITTIEFITSSYAVYDGSGDLDNCTDIDKVQWTYNNGVFLYGAAMMYNQTTGSEQATWQSRVEGLLEGAKVFFQNQVMYEVACEPRMNCDTDQLSFKAYLSRWMAATTKVAPFTIDTIMPYIQQSAMAAAKSCNPGDTGAVCGTQWTTGSYDGSTGVGQQMSALEVIQSNLIKNVAGPVSQGNGGISKGDPSAGTGGDTGLLMSRITTGDKAGAGILTLLMVVIILGGTWWLVTA